MRIDGKFFSNKDSLILARELLGKVLTKVTPVGIISGIINEVEAYREDDEASHTFGGRKSERNEVMFREAGHLYVYFTYGMYHCMNIVTEEYGYGAAVLIRSVIPYIGEDLMIKNRNWQGKKSSDLVNGPAKVCLAYDISKKDNGINLLEAGSNIFLEDIGYNVPKIQVSRRIGISKGIYKERRFWF